MAPLASRWQCGACCVALAIFMLQSRHIVRRLLPLPLCAKSFYFARLAVLCREMWQRAEGTGMAGSWAVGQRERGRLWALACLEMVTKCVISVMQRHSAAQRAMRGSQSRPKRRRRGRETQRIQRRVLMDVLMASMEIEIVWLSLVLCGAQIVMCIERKAEKGEEEREARVLEGFVEVTMTDKWETDVA